VSLLVRGDDAADGGQLVLAHLFGMTRRVAVGDERRSLLEGRVDESIVRVLINMRFLQQLVSVQNFIRSFFFTTF